MRKISITVSSPELSELPEKTVIVSEGADRISATWIQARRTGQGPAGWGWTGPPTAVPNVPMLPIAAFG